MNFAMSVAAFVAAPAGVYLRVRCEVAESFAGEGTARTKSGRLMSWRQRLTLAANGAKHRVTFQTPRMEEIEALRVRRIRCEVFAENSGITGRATFNVGE